MKKFFSEHIISVVGDALLYSLAVGILLAVATGIIILTTRKASPKTRYDLLVTALTLFAGAVIFTFIKQLFFVQAIPPFYNNSTGPVTLTGVTIKVSDPVNEYTSITGFVRSHANTIVLLWSLIVVIKSFQLMTGLQSLHLLKRNNFHTVGEYWEQRVHMLSHQLGIQRIVRIAASGIAKVPMVIGHLKPVILVPIGLLTSLSPESIEAILIHELAHIRRRDWLVNLLISTLEVIFFFNPAVLWISSLIRTERENCCDDIAIAYTGSKVNYIDTLVACQEFQQSLPTYSLAFSGPKKPLLARVKRMISDKNSSLNRAERGVMALSLVIALAGILLLGSSYKNKKISSRSTTTSIITDSTYYVKADTYYAADSMVSISDSVSSPGDSLTSVSIPDHPSAYGDSIPATIAGDTLVTKQASIYPNGEFTVYQRKEITYPADVTVPNADVLSRLVRLDSNLYQVNTQSGDITSMQVNGNTIAPEHHLNYLEKISHVTSNYRNYTSQPYIAEHDSYQQKHQTYDEETNLKKLIETLIAANLIHYKEELLSFKLSDTEFIMNGIKMPEKIYQPLKKAFVPIPPARRKGSWAWMYNFKT